MFITMTVDAEVSTTTEDNGRKAVDSTGVIASGKKCQGEQ